MPHKLFQAGQIFAIHVCCSTRYMSDTNATAIVNGFEIVSLLDMLNPWLVAEYTFIQTIYLRCASEIGMCSC